MGKGRGREKGQRLPKEGLRLPSIVHPQEIELGTLDLGPSHCFFNLVPPPTPHTSLPPALESTTFLSFSIALGKLCIFIFQCVTFRSGFFLLAQHHVYVCKHQHQPLWIAEWHFPVQMSHGYSNCSPVRIFHSMDIQNLRQLASVVLCVCARAGVCLTF